jgi:hypothetical protein
MGLPVPPILITELPEGQRRKRLASAARGLVTRESVVYVGDGRIPSRSLRTSPFLQWNASNRVDCRVRETARMDSSPGNATKPFQSLTSNFSAHTCACHLCSGRWSVNLSDFFQ